MEKTNLNLIRSYIQYRFTEVFVWCGIPFAGGFLAQMNIFSHKFIFGCVALISAIFFVLTFNDWGGLKKNPEEIKRYGLDLTSEMPLIRILRISAMISLGSALVFGGYVLGWKLLLLFGVSGFFLNILYSHPKFHLKENLIGSKVIHYVAGQFLFAVGYLSFSDQFGSCLYISIFFALILLGGHFIHEAADANEDVGSVQTWATVFGSAETARLGWRFFVAAHVYWLLLYLFQDISLKLFLIFSLPLGIHFIFMSLKNLKVYRLYYRIIYGAGVLLCAF